MNFKEMIYPFSIIILIMTGVYCLVYAKLSGFLMVAAVFFLCSAFVDSLEIIVACTVIFAVIHVIFLKPLIQSYTNGREGFSNTPKAITEEIKKRKSDWNEPTGVLSNSKTEGFADVSDPNVKKEGTSSNSQPASTERKDEVTQPQLDTKSLDTTLKSDKVEGMEFQSATNGLFKLGKMPSEEKGGGHLDPGKTLMKSMSSFDPKAISSMTEDTKKLLETQKGLMNMLTQMRPVLADGKELLQTFSGMFGNMKM